MALATFDVTLPPLPAPTLAASSALTLNRQTGLWEQIITVRNDGARVIGGFELLVGNVSAPTELHNASSFRNGMPLVGHYSPVAPGASVTLVLEYYAPDRRVPLLTIATALALPASTTAATAGASIDRAVMLAPGAFLIEFTAIPGRRYEVQYGDGTTWTASPVTVRAGGTRVQWIDRGAPRTTSPPSSAAPRYYRVRLLP